MMGRWIAQNKIRPNAYINFKSIEMPRRTIGDRGIVVIPMPLSWGSQEELIDVASTELLLGSSLWKVGFTAFDPASKLLAAALSYCYLAKVFRMDIGGTKASVEIGTAPDVLTVEALYNGEFGNEITIKVVDHLDGTFTVETFVLNERRDAQRVGDWDELQNNNWVTFTGEGTPVIDAGAVLTGGTDGTVVETDAYTRLLPLLGTARFQVLAVPTADAIIKERITRYVELQRDSEGKPMQAVLANYNVADYEGIISIENSCILHGEAFTTVEMTALIAGMMAGTQVTQSNTARVIRGATKIIGELTHLQIEDALQSGKLVLSYNQDGSVKIEQDINTLTTFTHEKNSNFRKNRIIRTLDEIDMTIRDIWQREFMGKVSNSNTGRMAFKTRILGYLSELDALDVIDEYMGAQDVEVFKGLDIDAVVANLHIKPVDSMEKLYATVFI